MNFSQKKIFNYCTDHTTPVSDVLIKLERETNLKTLAPQMASGAFQGKLLEMLVRMSKPKKVLEIGTFTGYSSICIGYALPEDATLHTIEVNRELQAIIQEHIKMAGLTEKIVTHVGNALEIIPTLDIKFDMVFIDAGKRDYAVYYDSIIDMVNPNGIILADNVLWSGKVVDKNKDNDTRIIDDFNKKVFNDPRVENITLPIRDGLTIAIKK